MDDRTVNLAALAGTASVTILSLMVPNALEARAVADKAVERGYYAALSSVAVIGLAVSILDGNAVPFIVAISSALTVIAAHNAIQHTGYVLT